MSLYIFTIVDPEEDALFLNNSGLEFSYIGYGNNDSGFRDAATGMQIVSKGDRFLVSPSSEYELFLELASKPQFVRQSEYL